MDANLRDTVTLTFHGPFKFTSGPDYLFTSEFAKCEGIYIWTIKDEVHYINYVHYIGETTGLGSRHREHLIGLTSMNYRIFDPECARQGTLKIIWNGMWKDKSPEAAARVLEAYPEISKRVVEYISLINVYFAPTTCNDQMRKHLEGCLGWNLRNKHPDLKTFYPDDNHVGTSTRTGQKMLVNLPEPIAGIDHEQTI